MMMNEDAINQAIDVLNRAVEADAVAMEKLCSSRTPCNQALADDPTIQVGTWEGETTVGMIGVLNGLFGINEHGWGAIGAIFESDGSLSGFKRTSPADWGELTLIEEGEG